MGPIQYVSHRKKSKRIYSKMLTVALPAAGRITQPWDKPGAFAEAEHNGYRKLKTEM